MFEFDAAENAMYKPWSYNVLVSVEYRKKNSAPKRKTNMDGGGLEPSFARSTSTTL
jgi:hypothetical protein